MRYEDDIPTKKETESESSRFQKQNEHSRQEEKYWLLEELKGRKKLSAYGHIFVVFSFLKKNG